MTLSDGIIFIMIRHVLVRLWVAIICQKPMADRVKSGTYARDYQNVQFTTIQ